MSSGTHTPTSSNSGITETTDGTRIIPSSVRSDGSTRREIRVRPGYRPPEDVEIYKNRTAEAWRNKGKTSGIPGVNPVDNNRGSPEDSKKLTKNAKKRAAKKKKAANAQEEEGEEEPVEDAETIKKKENDSTQDSPAVSAKTTTTVAADSGTATITTTTSTGVTTTTITSTSKDGSTGSNSGARLKSDLTEEEKEKQARAIRKKLRQATDLKSRKENGENLLPEQVEKVIRISELSRQLKSLGFSE